MSQLNTISFKNEWVSPSKIVCIGRNYLDHITELGNQIPFEPVIFLKPNSAISEDLNSKNQDEIHYEGELCFIIKNGEIAGLGFGLDLTKRKLQSQLKEKGLPWERAKAFDGSAVFSAFVELPADISNLTFALSVNEHLVQQGRVKSMMNTPYRLVENISAFMSLVDNDIIMTGTPSGVGKVEKGQIFLGEVFDGTQGLISKQWTVLS